MVEFLTANFGTIAAAIILILVIALIISGMKKDKRSGRSSCGGSCGCCPNSALCHGGKNIKAIRSQHK